MKRKPRHGNVRNVRHIDGNIRWTIIVFGSHIYCESANERKFILRLSRKKTVHKVVSQPTTIEYVDREGKNKAYTPDFMVCFADGSIAIYEITLASRRSSPGAQDRERAGAEAAQTRGWTFYVLTVDDLPGETEFANLMALYRFRAHVYENKAVGRWVKENLLPKVSHTLKALLSVIAQQLGLAEERVFTALAYLIWHGEIDMNLQERLLFIDAEPEMSTLIWLPSEEAA